MAPKRSNPLEDPPAASSEEEETTSSEEEEDGEDEEATSSEDEPKKSSPPRAQTAKSTAKKPDLATQKAESDSESDTGTETDSDSDSEAVKPIASKPMEETPAKNTKPRSKPSASSQVAAKSSAKRGIEVDRDEKDPKKAKKKEPESDGAVEKSEDTKKQLFQRLWSEDDEIAVLKGIIEFTEKKGADPTKDMGSFHDFIKKSLHFDVTLNQLKDKVWRLKKKFENHVSKGKKGEDKTFSKPHDQKAFDLWKKIWGSEGILVDWGVKSNGKAKKSGSSKNLAALKAELGVGLKESEKVDKMEIEMENHSGLKEAAIFDKMVGMTGMEDYVVKKGLDMISGAKKAEMEEKWRKLHVAELELFLRRNELITEQAKLMLAAYKNE